MESHSLIAILGLAFGLGMMHALDADHIMAVTGLASTRPSFKQTLNFCANWAIGHGLALLVIGFGVIMLGMAIPTSLSTFCEHLVGIVLIGIGAWVIFNSRRRHNHIHFHRHDGLPNHAHWHHHSPSQHATHTPESHKHNHSAILVGLLHGTAGSAPLLALIPITQYASPIYAMLYLLLFGLGVLAAMLVFGGFLSGIYQWLANYGKSLIQGIRISVGISAVCMGTYLLVTGFKG